MLKKVLLMSLSDAKTAEAQEKHKEAIDQDSKVVCQVAEKEAVFPDSK